MRKSVLAMVAVAAMGVAGAANAGFFTIAGASYNPGSVAVGPNGGNFSITTHTTDFAISSTGAAGSASALNAGDVTALNALSWQADSVNYFSFRDSNDLGYFGIALNLATGRTMSIDFGSFASAGTKGVLTNHTITGTPIFDDSTFKTFSQSFAAGLTYFIFGGLENGVGFQGSVANSGTQTAFGVNYLTYNGSAFTSIASVATGATTSSLSVATYVVPVPAPMLLAGAGLIGAAALRRRMVKKA